MALPPLLCRPVRMMSELYYGLDDNQIQITARPVQPQLFVLVFAVGFSKKNAFKEIENSKNLLFPLNAKFTACRCLPTKAKYTA